jgi:hypothetical protein
MSPDLHSLAIDWNFRTKTFLGHFPLEPFLRAAALVHCTRPALPGCVWECPDALEHRSEPASGQMILRPVRIKRDEKTKPDKASSFAATGGSAQWNSRARTGRGSKSASSPQVRGLLTRGRSKIQANSTSATARGDSRSLETAPKNQCLCAPRQI